NRITIDDDGTFVQFSAFGFYRGIVFNLLGAFLFEGSLADKLMNVGILSVVFLTAVVTWVVALFQYMISSHLGLEWVLFTLLYNRQHHRTASVEKEIVAEAL